MVTVKPPKTRYCTGEKCNLANASQEHQRTRISLLDKYEKAEQLYSNLMAEIKTNLEETYSDVPKAFQERKESLKSGECTIVVAGGVGSGKSSFLNLVLETNIFPTNALKCTNTICEIRYDERKVAIFYYKRILSDSGQRDRKVSPKIVTLDDSLGVKEFQYCVTETNQNDDNPYERCEVFYPFLTLGKGVVLVDTPGIEGGENVDQRLQTYLSKAFGFIYVINASADGGAQPSRLGHLLKTVVNSCEVFNPEASLFIGNKWENVPEKDRDDVKEDTFNKLSKIYPGIRSHQLNYMSVKTSTDIMTKFKKYNARTQEHNVLLEKVSQMVPKSLRQRMISHYGWLSSFLSRTSYLLRVTSARHAMTREVMEKQYKHLHQHVENVKKNGSDCVKRLKDKLEFEVYRISNAVKRLLEDKDFVNKLCNWEDSYECPSTEKKWKHIVDCASMKISDRIASTVDGWVRGNGVLSNIDREIIEVFSKDLGLMDHQIQELEACLSGSKNGSPLNHVKVMPVKALFTKRLKRIEQTYFTLGGAVSCIGMLDTDKKNVRNIFRKGYNENTKGKKMTEATTVYLETILANRDFSAKLRKFFERFFKDIEEAARRIPYFLQEADQHLIDNLQKSIANGERITQTFPEHVSGCSELLAKLDIFYINEIMQFDFELSELDWDKKTELGRGSFAIVYASNVKGKGKSVALKVSIDKVDRSNVTDVLSEDRTMRDLRHSNVVKYYGASYEKVGRGLRWIMVMDLCQTTLKHIYTGPEKIERNIPGCLDKDHHRHKEASKLMLDHALQISRGLEYIHDKGYTHRDMKLENVLLADGNVIKITDVGVTKVTQDLFFTCKGSPAYMSPEVLTADSAQTNMVDIYSMTMMFWEMWFGKDVAELMDELLLDPGIRCNAMKVLIDKVAKPGGWRPPLSSPRRPPDVVCDMLKKGWSYEPDKRPTTQQICQTLNEFISNNFEK